jgi:single-stranded DNA-binding protein
MSAPLNHVELTGRAGHDVDRHALSDGTPYARLRIYHDTRDHAGDHAAIPFVVTAWGDLADAFYRDVRKGDNLLLHGRLRLRTWSQGGICHSRPEIHLNRFFLLNTSKKRTDFAPAVDEAESAE